MRTRIYRALARLLLPPSFRRGYGDEILDSLQRRLAAEEGAFGRNLLLVRELLDLVRTSGREWGRLLGGSGGPRPTNRWPGPLEIAAGLGRDIRFALRQMRRAPGFSGVVVLTLAVGIGLNTTVFAAVHSLLLRPAAGVQDPDRLVQLFRAFPGLEYGANSIPHVRDLQERTGALFTGVAAWSHTRLSLQSGDGADVVAGQVASANFFEVLGARPALGRTFLPEEARGAGAHPVVVLSHGTWRERFAGDPRVLGRTIHLNGRPFVVVGVMPEGFRGVTRIYAPALWLPLSMYPLSDPGSFAVHDSRDASFLEVFARLQPGVGLEAARNGIEPILARLTDEHPEDYGSTGIRVLPQGRVSRTAINGVTPVELGSLVMGVVAVLLLIASVNVATLFLSRTQHRRREIGVRLSLGAPRGRVLQQLIVESLVLASFAALGALALGALALRALNGISPPTSLPVDLALELTPAALLFTAAVALSTGLLFGVAPALRMSGSASLNELRNAGGRGGNGRLSRGLVVAQTGLSLVLLMGAALFLQSLWATTRLDVAFDADALLSARVSPSLGDHDETSVESFYRQVAERLRGQPGVADVSWADVTPLGPGSGQATRISIPGRAVADDGKTSVHYAWIGPRYFETMGIPLVRGRGLGAQDDSTSWVVVVNQSMAETFWPGRDPLGQVVETQGGKMLQVVGVARNSTYRALDEEPGPYMYLSLAQNGYGDASLFVRTVGDPVEVAPTLRRIAREVDPTMPLHQVQTMNGHIGIHLLPARITAATLGLFGVLALILSTTGLYGVVSYTISRQTRTIGIRMALGAEQSRVLASVLADGMRLSLSGIGLGLVLSVLGALGIRDLLIAGPMLDPRLFIGVVGLMTLVSALATLIPARRAARLDPVRALKEE